jgi:chemotaxis protein methyltransferase CheR
LNFLTDEDFILFKDKIYKESGIHFSAVNRPILESRKKERLKHTSIDTTTDYFSLINNDKEELLTLLDTVTTNLTKFFRNEPQFETLKKLVIPEIIERKRNTDKKIHIWSAGCSTGEEPYTIGILLLDVLGSSIGWDLLVIASDISLKSLKIAKSGEYEKERIENIDQYYLDKYFTMKDENLYLVKDDVKKLVRFDYHNLKHFTEYKDLDIIFCRNVIIYFDREAQVSVIKKFEKSIDKNGYLFIGHSESLFGMDTGFKFHKVGNSCVYRLI